jgi:peptide alpha-N-acetyltransferase
LPAQAAEVIDTEFEKLLPKSQNLEEWNESFLSANKNSVAHIQAALSGRQLLKPDSKAQCEKDLVASLDTPTVTIEEAVVALELLSKWGSDQTAYAEKASKKWPESSVFQLN